MARLFSRKPGLANHSRELDVSPTSQGPLPRSASMNYNAASWVIATAAAVVALAAWWETRKARQAAEGSEKSAKASAEAAGRSADEAERMTRIESDRLRDERDARHEALAPVLEGKVTIDLEGANPNRLGLFGWITLARTYRVQAEGWTGSALTPTSGLPVLLHAHTRYKFHIEHWPNGRTKPQTQELRFRFWPPVADLDDTDAWTCPCHRPSGETMNGPGHWEVRVPVEPPVEPFALFS